MQGKFLLSSFQDAHIHPVWGGIAQLGCPVFDLATRKQLLAEIATCVKSKPEDSIIQAIAGYTIGAAHTNFLDVSTGSIEVGKFADIIVVDRDLFKIPVTEISQAKVLVTLLEGEEVFGELTEK